MRRPLVLLAVLPLAWPAAGCGATDTGQPEPSTRDTRTASYPHHGLTFQTPAGWSLRGGTAPLVATVRTGPATVAIWRFERSEPLPKTPQELDAARVAILEESLRRDPTFAPIKSAATRVAGWPAVQIRARETVAGRRQVVRSTHIFHAGAEVVVEAYADPDSFRTVDAGTFRPLLRSLRVVAVPGGA